MKSTTLKIAILSIGLTSSAYSQCYVSAGPDIDVCQEGTVQLHGTFEGNVTHLEWSGGSGKFDPSPLLLETEYTPSESEYGTTVHLTLTATTKGTCPAEMKDEIELTVNVPVEANAGLNMHVCMNDVQLNGKVKGKAKKTTWITNGSGTFDDASKLNAIYTPSEKDLSDKAVSLTLKAESFGVCGSDESTIILMLDKGISFTTPTEIFANGTEPVKLTVKSDATGDYLWSGKGTGTFTKKNEKESIYIPSLEDANKESISFQVQVADPASSCTSKHVVIVHFKGK